jgi:TetR/AcrR family transcriptional regulator
MKDQQPQTRIQAKNRALIMAAGLDVFSQYGLRGSTLDQIATAAKLSKPNVLYYFSSKDAIYTAILERLLETWLDPLRELNATGEPIDEILGYVSRKLTLSREFPRESRMFANEILQGAPHIADELSGDLRRLVEEKSQVIQGWIDLGRIRPIDPKHLFFSIWSQTQHYADFETQVSAVLGKEDYFGEASDHVETMFRRILTP